MIKTRSVLFISYSHDDIDRDTLDYLNFLLTKHSQGAYDVLIDQELSYGSDLNEFMSLISSAVDVVIILMTPSYGMKVKTKTGGAYKEYRKIIQRYHEIQK